MFKELRPIFLQIKILDFNLKVSLLFQICISVGRLDWCFWVCWYLCLAHWLSL